MSKKPDIPVTLTVAKKPLVTSHRTPTTPSLQPAKSKGFGCLYCPLLPTVKGVKIGDDYKGCNSKQLAESRKIVDTHRMHGSGPKDPKVLVVLDRPEARDDQAGEALQGNASKAILRMMTDAGIDTAKIRFTFAVRCHTGKVRDTAIKACNGYLAAEIERTDPDIIVGVGTDALKTIAGPKYGIESCGGTPFKQEVCGKTRIVLGVWSAQYMHVFSEKHLEWEKQFRVLAGLITGEVKLKKGLGVYKQIHSAEEAAAMLDAIQDGDFSTDIETNCLDPRRTDVPVPDHLERVGRLKFVPRVIDCPEGRTLKNGKPKQVRAVPTKTEKATIAMVSWTTKTGEGFFVARDHVDGTWTDHDRMIFDAAYIRLLRRKSVRKIFWNAMFECTWFRVKWGVIVRNFEDAMVLHYLIDENEKHSLKEASSRYTGMGRWDADVAAVDGEALFNHNFRHIPLDISGPYSGADPDGTLRIFLKLRPKLSAAKLKLQHKLYPPLTVALTGMQDAGAKGDLEFTKFYVKYTKRIADKARKELETLPEVRRYVRKMRRKHREKEGRRDAWELNLNSPPQLRYICFKILKREELYYTDKGLPKTNKVSLKAWVRHDKCEFSKKLLQYRKFVKLHSTYAVGGLDHQKAFDGFIRGYFRILGARTGRLCVAPDTQIDTDLGRLCISDIPAALRERRIYTVSHTGKRVEIVDAFIKGYEPMLTVRFEDGSFIKGTAGHRVFDGRRWKRLDEFAVRDFAKAGIYSSFRQGCGQVPNSGTFDAERNGQGGCGPLAVQRECCQGSSLHVLEDSSQYVGSFGPVLGRKGIRGTGCEYQEFEICSLKDGEFAREDRWPQNSPSTESSCQVGSTRMSFGKNRQEIQHVCLVCSAQHRHVRSGRGDSPSVCNSRVAGFSSHAGNLVSGDNRTSGYGRVLQKPKAVFPECVSSTPRDDNNAATTIPSQESCESSRARKRHVLVCELRRSPFYVDTSTRESIAREAVSNTGNTNAVRFLRPVYSSISGDRRAIPSIGVREENRRYKGCVGEEKRMEGLEDTPNPSRPKSGKISANSSEEVRVASIEKSGLEEVWDLTVNHPDHSYSSQGLFHHNSSSSPNLQNQDRLSRRMYVSRFGKKGCIVAMDYSQAELRVLASISGDEAMLRVYRDGLDIHKNTMSAVYGLSLDEIKKLEETNPVDYEYKRTICKRVVFGVAYCIAATGLANLLFGEGIEISQDEAQEYIDKFMRLYRGVARWIEDEKKRVRKYGRSVSPMGRVRKLDAAKGDLGDPEERKRVNEAIRQGVNAVIQGAASDLTLTSIILIDRELRKRKLRSRLFLTVHDSIAVDCPISEAAEVAELSKRIMENVHKLSASVWGKDFDWSWIKCPLGADVKIGVTWRDCVGYDPSLKESTKKSKRTVREAIAASIETRDAEDEKMRQEYRETQKWHLAHERGESSDRHRSKRSDISTVSC